MGISVLLIIMGIAFLCGTNYFLYIMQKKDITPIRIILSSCFTVCSICCILLSFSFGSRLLPSQTSTSETNIISSQEMTYTEENSEAEPQNKVDDSENDEEIDFQWLVKQLVNTCKMTMRMH